jgi:hypothetical protein
MQLHVWFRKDQATETFLNDTNTGLFVLQSGIGNVPNTSGALRWHGDVSGMDGHDQWVAVEHYNPKYVNWIPRNDSDGRCVHHGKTLEYTATISAVGIDLGVLTSFSRDVEDCMFTGGGNAHHHWEWGDGGSFISAKAQSSTATRSRQMRRRIALAVLCALLAAAAGCSSPVPRRGGPRVVLAVQTGITDGYRRNTRELIDIGLPILHNLTSHAVRLRSVQWVNQPASARIASVHAYTYAALGHGFIGDEGDLPVACPGEYQPSPGNVSCDAASQ